ncbi:MAG: hypothetical protein LBT00_02160 [Spirochaetaceae bacterium]|jgi:hypothetical protein|nr:hypothetical protein [Spirochaetaceae bacterium]
MNFSALFAQAANYVKTTTTGKIILVIVVLLLFLIIAVPLIRRLKRRKIKEKETREIMKDLLTWRHLAQLVKGGGGHEKAKQELSDNILKINDLLKQGFHKAARRGRDLYAHPWFVLVGEPRSGKSSLLEASDLELEPSTVERDTTDDGKNSLPVRIWGGTKAAVCDISGKVFFDRWLEGSSAEWMYITRQICRYRRKRPLDGIIVTIPADALLADSADLSSHKAILMARELHDLLHNCGMNLPCYVIVTKLDLVNGFQEYAKFLEGDMRHQILGFSNNAKFYSSQKFEEFWAALRERLVDGAKQLLTENARRSEQSPETRMDTAAKIWTFPDTFGALNENIKIYLDALFGEDNYHGTSNTYFEGIYFTSAQDRYISLSPAMARLSGLTTDELAIPSASYRDTAYPDRPVQANPAASNSLMTISGRQPALTPVNRRPDLHYGYFIRDVFHKRVFRESEHVSFTRRKALMLHLPHYLLCAVFIGAGLYWGLTALFNAEKLHTNLLQISTYYTYLDGLLQKGAPFYSPLVKEDSPGHFVVDMEPVEGESLSSRVQFFYNAVVFRDMAVTIPPGFGLSRIVTDGFQPNYRYKDKAFIANQLYATMVRMPVIRNVGNKIIGNVQTQVLTADVKAVLTSFLELDDVKNTDFNQMFRSGKFKFDSMPRYLIPDLSNDTANLLKQYKSQYERDYSYRIAPDYIYSDDFAKAKDAALNTIISAWDRYAVYPDSLYGKIKRLAAISEEILTNYADITDSLRRVNTVITLDQVRELVYEWKALTNRQKNILSEGRALFAEVTGQLRAAHIPLAFDNPLPTINISGGAGATLVTTRPVPDAYRDNLINDYLFNDMVIGLAVKEYTALFDADMAFVRQKLGASGQERAGRIIALQGEFGNRLATEVQDLRSRAAKLQGNELLAGKADEKSDASSLFSIVEKIVDLSSDIALPVEKNLANAGFETNWQEGQGNIKTALDTFDAYAADYLENKKVGLLVANARTMLLAQAYFNRYTIFTTTLSYLYTFESNIAGIVESQAGQASAVSFSDNALEKTLGIYSYNRLYDPPVTKKIVENVVSFASLFSTPGENPPLFLQNVPPSVYKPDAFLKYLGSYIRYWGRYPDSVYRPEHAWADYRRKMQTVKAFQINAALQTIYLKSIEALNVADNVILSEALAADKNGYVAALNDKVNILSEFLSTDAERMIATWMKLPDDPIDAFRVLQAATDEELKESYLSVRTEDSALAIGWWNDFAFNGIKVLSDEFKQMTETTLFSQTERLKQYPLCADASVENPLSLNIVKDIAALLDSMGAGIAEPETEPVKQALHPVLFKGSALPWAKKIHRFASAVADSQKPLSWTIAQPSIAVQNSLPANGRLLAVNRFRYIEAKVENQAAVRVNAYMNQKTTLAQGYADDGAIILRFFRTSGDTAPQTTVTISNKWAAFNLYFQKDAVKGNDINGNEVFYTPILVPADGTQYVYFVELSFNREIPSRDEWNTVRTFPDLVIQDGFITGNTFVVGSQER